MSRRAQSPDSTIGRGGKGTESRQARERLKNCNGDINASPITDIDQAIRSSRVPSEADNSLRRRSYRRAVAAEQEPHEKSRNSFGRDSSTRSHDLRRRSLSEGPLIIKPSSVRDSLLSSSSSSIGSDRGGDSRRMDSHAWFGSEGNLSMRTSGGRTNSLTDQSRNSTPRSSTRSGSRACALALLDSLKGEESVDDDTCSVQSEPYAPRARHYRSRLLPTPAHVTRTPSGSSSSSESGDSWRSAASQPVSGISRQRKIPRTPSPESVRIGARYLTRPASRPQSHCGEHTLCPQIRRENAMTSHGKLLYGQPDFRSAVNAQRGIDLEA